MTTVSIAKPAAQVNHDQAQPRGVLPISVHFVLGGHPPPSRILACVGLEIGCVRWHCHIVRGARGRLDFEEVESSDPNITRIPPAFRPAARAAALRAYSQAGKRGAA
jgi:hypothetical protein